MKNNIILSILFFLFFSVFSCDNRNNSEYITSKESIINVSEFKQLSKNNSSVIEDLDYFRLETTKKSLIGKVNKVLVNDKNILILDTRIAEVVFSFDHLGKYIGKIGNKGNGPQEYNFLEDMDLDSKNNLHLLDLRKSKVMKFSLDGSFISEQKFGFKTYKFAALNDNSYVFDQGTRDNSEFKNEVNLNYKLITWNPNLQKLNKFLSYNHEYDNPSFPLPNPYHVYRSGSKLNYLKPYEYTIYELISDNEVIAKYQIDFGKYKVPKSFYSNNPSNGIIHSLIKSDYAHSITNIYETSKHLCFNFLCGNNLYWVAISKKDNSLYVRDLAKMDLSSYPFLLMPQAVINDQFITVLDSDTIKSYIDHWGENKFKEAGLSIFIEHNSNMNPIVFKWSLKDEF